MSFDFFFQFSAAILFCQLIMIFVSPLGEVGAMIIILITFFLMLFASSKLQEDKNGKRKTR